MMKRGVTRPMQGQGEHHGDRDEMMRSHHQQTQWVYWTIMLLGAWTVLAPLTFGYDSASATPAGGRELWLSLEARAAAMKWSEIVSGVLLIVLGWRALTPDRPVTVWLCCGVGVWLSAAPIVFWSPSAAAYVTDTIVGMLVIALTILVPGMPNMVRYMKMGEPTPPGWSYNPSSWTQRSILIALGFAGMVVSRYLAAFQLGYIDTVWDPFFGDGSRQVLTSSMSESLPISDAGLGTYAYTFEFLMGFMGSKARWRTMPWMVTLFGILVIPLGLVHIFLVVSQPIVVGQWCTMCLLAAAIMLPMLPLEGDEVVAMGQHVAGARRRGESLWRVFWKGGSAEDAEPDEISPDPRHIKEHPLATMRASTWGMSLPWNLVLASIIGAALMAVPDSLGVARPASIAFQLGGAIVLTASVVAMGEVFRALRFLNIPVGVTVAIAPLFFAGAGLTAQIVAVVAGLVITGISIGRGTIRERYGSWDRFVV